MVFLEIGFFSSSKLAISALLNGFASEIGRKQKSQTLIEEILSFGKEPFITTEPLTPIKKEETELLVFMCITNEEKKNYS